MAIDTGQVDTSGATVFGAGSCHLDPREIDPATFGPMSGAVDVGDLSLEVGAFDLDGNSVLDSRVLNTENGVTVVSDFDGDGSADRLTMIESDGDYAAWECHRDQTGSLVWEKIDGGAL